MCRTARTSCRTSPFSARFRRFFSVASRLARPCFRLLRPGPDEDSTAARSVVFCFAGRQSAAFSCRSATAMASASPAAFARLSACCTILRRARQPPRCRTGLSRQFRSLDAASAALDTSAAGTESGSAGGAESTPSRSGAVPITPSPLSWPRTVAASVWTAPVTGDAPGRGGAVPAPTGVAMEATSS